MLTFSEIIQRDIPALIYSSENGNNNKEKQEKKVNKKRDKTENARISRETEADLIWEGGTNWNRNSTPNQNHRSIGYNIDVFHSGMFLFLSSYSFSDNLQEFGFGCSSAKTVSEGHFA